MPKSSFPQWAFWAVGALTPITYCTAAGFNYYLGHYSRQFLPFPSACIAALPERYIFGWSAAVVVPLMMFAAWRVFRHLSQPRFGRKNTLSNILIYACVAMGFAAAALYGIAAFWTVADGLWLHLAFHMGSLATLVLFFTLYDVVSYRARGSLSTLVLVHDIVMIAVAAGYSGACYFVLKHVVGVFFSIWSVTGYVAILIAFTRYWTLGWQMTETQNKRHN